VGTTAEREPDVTSPQPCQKTVLVVEDEPELRDVLCHVLSDASIRAVPARDGLDALSYLRREAAPDAIVLDLLMPEIDGLAVLDALRADDTLPRSPIVIISAASRELVARALAHRPLAVLPKPLDAVRLVKTVRAACGLDPDVQVRRVA
jgi:CheY-like chemotaxis protein